MGANSSASSTEKLAQIVLACDESGAKGYADGKERFPGEVGVFAGILVPVECLDTVQAVFDAIVKGYVSSTGKLHITDLASVDQEKLRSDIYDAVRQYHLPCFWEAIHVAGFHNVYVNQKEVIERTRPKRRSRIKLSGNAPAPDLLHVELFQGLYGKVLAFCAERERKNLEIEVRTDNVDSPVVRDFERVSRKLLDLGPTKTRKTGFDPATKKVVTGEIETTLTLPRELDIDVKVLDLKLEIADEHDGLVLAADVLANSLAYLFHNRSDEEKYRALNPPQAIARHPLANLLESFYEWGSYNFADTFYRHPDDPDLPSGKSGSDHSFS